MRGSQARLGGTNDGERLTANYIQDHPPIISGIYIDTTNCDFLILYKYLDIFKRNDGIYY